MNLIYFTINNNKDYINLFQLCIESLNRFEYNGDLLVITNFKDEIKDKIKTKNNLFFMDVDSTNLLHSSSNKLKIYNYELIEKYEKIIFCDIDTIWFDSPNILFNEIKENKIYMCSEHHQENLMSHNYWSGNLMTPDEINHINNNKIKGLNGGFFGFKKKC